jgi:flavorubredoxin
MDEGLFWVGAQDFDRRLFDELIPLPEGTSYNAYWIRGEEKTALIDCVDPSKCDDLFARLSNLGVRSLDYVVANHAEQDHSGALPRVLERFPSAMVLATPKCKDMLMDHLHVPGERIRSVDDGESVSLGGRTLKFIHFPWVHWPETMLTWCPELRTLFPCDLFGSHLAANELWAGDDPALLPAAKRYYAEIMMPFAGLIAKNLSKLDGLGIRVIAPSHGPVHEKPSRILDAYKEWTGARPRNLAVVAYVSMHDSTRLAVERLVDSLGAMGVRAEQFDLKDADIGRLAVSLVDAATIVLGSPTVIGGPHPKAAYAAMLANLLKPKARWAAVIGSYGWGGRMVEQLAALMPNLKAEMLPPVVFRGMPRPADYEAIDRLAAEIRQRHSGLN